MIIRTNKNRQRALTFIDVIMGMGILGVVLLSLFASFSFGFDVVRLSQEELRATQVVQDKMEVIRLYTWTQVTSSGFVRTNFTETLIPNGPSFFYGTLQISGCTNAPAAYSTNLRQVFVTLVWTNYGQGTNFVKRTREATTFVSRYGLQNYSL